MWLVPADCPNYEFFAVSLKNPSSIPAASYLEVLREESTQWAVPFRVPKQLIESAYRSATLVKSNLLALYLFVISVRLRKYFSPSRGDVS